MTEVSMMSCVIVIDCCHGLVFSFIRTLLETLNVRGYPLRQISKQNIRPIIDRLLAGGLLNGT